VAEKLVDLKVDSMSVSIDGPDATHDEIRRGKGSFKRLAEGIRNITAAKKERDTRRPLVGITCTIFALNQHNFSEVVDAVHDLGVASVDYEYMFYATQDQIDRTRAMIAVSAWVVGGVSTCTASTPTRKRSAGSANPCSMPASAAKPRARAPSTSHTPTTRTSGSVRRWRR
jgi:hypothetical protein